MAAKKQDSTVAYKSICEDIKRGRFAPVYLLHGEEPYFINQITELLLNNVLTDEEKDFNLLQFYGAETDNVGDVVTACRRYPMMADKQLILFRELQAFDNRTHKLDDLSLYIEHPLESTILVLTCKTKTLGEKLTKLVKKINGVVFESNKLSDYNLQEKVEPYIKERGLTIDAKALVLLCESIGTNLSRMFHEIDKLSVNLKGKVITSDIVAEHIGISKDFNNYELLKAIAGKDFYKVEMIRRYFAANPKTNPIQPTLSALFSFFTDLLLAYSCPDKTIKGLMATIKVNFPTAQNLVSALKNYNERKTIKIISIIRDYDAMCKGAREVTLTDAEALQEMLYLILH